MALAFEQQKYKMYRVGNAFNIFPKRTPNLEDWKKQC